MYLLLLIIYIRIITFYLLLLIIYLGAFVQVNYKV